MVQRLRLDDSVMRQVCVAVVVGWTVLTTVALSCRFVGADGYHYPYRDPHLATVTSAILNADRLESRLKREVVHVPGLPGRNELPSLRGRGSLSISFYRQEQPAPLVFILSGVGTNPYFGLATYYATLLHQQGSHVVILPSPMTWNFALAASRSGAPGYAPADARDLYDVMQTTLSILRQRYAVKTTSVNFMGASLGALEGAYLSVLDAEQRSIGIDKFLLLNPPVDLEKALARIDEWHALGAKLGVQRAKGIVGEALRIVESFRKDRRDDAAIFDQVAVDFSICTREELQFLIAEDLQASLPELIYVAEIVRGHITASALKRRVRQRLQDVKGVTLARYVESIALPAWRLESGEPGAERQRFVTSGSLPAIADQLRDNPRVHIMHNADDFLGDAKAIEEVAQALGARMTVYPAGGHLGNAWYAENKEAVLRFFRRQAGDQPARR